MLGDFEVTLINDGTVKLPVLNLLTNSTPEKLVLWGDLMHVASVQFEDPSVTIQFDTDSKAAAPQRMAAYAAAARDGYIVGSTHLAFPGLGRLRANADGKGYTFVPLVYSGLK